MLFFWGLLVFSIALIQCLIGGTRLVFALPSYGILAAGAALAAFGIRHKRKRPDSACITASIGVFSYVLVRAVCSPWNYLWWGDFFMVAGCLMAYALTALELQNPQWRSAVVMVLIGLAVVEFFVGLRQFSRGDSWMPFGFIRSDNSERASGMFISSIHLAGYLEAVGAFALSFAFWSRWAGWARFLAGYLALICYAGVAFTGSRGGYASSIAAVGAIAILSLVVVKRTRPQRFRFVLAATSLAVVVGLAGAGTLMWQSALLRHRFKVTAAEDARIYNWQAALDQFRVAPVFGTGAGTHLYYGRLFRRAPLQADPIHAHSDYLELLAEYGLVGAAGMVVFLYTHLRHGLRKFSYIVDTGFADLAPYEAVRSDILALVMGALAAVAAYLVHSAVDFNLHIPGNALTFAFIFGILAGPAFGEEGQRPQTGLSWSFRLIAPLIGLWMLAAGAWQTARAVYAGHTLRAPWPWQAAMLLPRMPGEYWCEQTRQALRAGKYETAIELAGHALNFEQHNPDLYFHLGEAHRSFARSIPDRTAKRAHFEAAVAEYRNSLALFPFDEDALARLGQTLDELGRFAEARETYETALRHDPNLAILHAYYARHLARVGRAEEAQKESARAIHLGAQDLHNILIEALQYAPEPSQ